MALIAEDGTGKADANSLVSLEEAIDVAIQHDYTAFLNTQNWLQEKALIEATATLDGTYSWRGALSSSTQALGFPRRNLIDGEGRLIASDAVPARLKQAVVYLASQQVTGGELLPTQSGGAVKSIRVGSLAKEYADASDNRRTFPFVDALLRGLYKGTGAFSSGVAQVPLVRA